MADNYSEELTRKLSKIACFYDEVNMAEVRALVKHGANPYYVNDNNQNLLHCVTSGNNCMELFKFLVEECNLDFSRKDKDGNTPLHNAANWAPRIVWYLISKGVDINDQNNAGKNLLDLVILDNWGINLYPKVDLENINEIITYYSGIKHRVKYIQALTEAGALQCAAENTALGKVFVSILQKGFIETLDDLIKEHSTKTLKGKENILHNAVSRGNLELVKHLLEKYPDSFDVNSTLYERPMVYEAFLSRSFEIVDYLLSKGAELQVKEVKKFKNPQPGELRCIDDTKIAAAYWKHLEDLEVEAVGKGSPDGTTL